MSYTPTQNRPHASLIKKVFWPALEGFIIFVVVVIIVALFDKLSAFASAFTLIDSYLRLVLTSWPAIILILGLLLFIFHSSALDNAIRRLIKAGPVELQPQEQNAQELRSDVAEVAPAASATAAPAITTPAARTTQADDVNRLRQENETLRQELETRTKSFLFEKTYRLIFGGQLRILLTAFYSTTGTIRAVDAFQIHSEIARAYPIIASNFPYPNYMQFLYDAGMLESVGVGSDQMRLTPMGREFLQYLNAHNITTIKPF